MGRNKLTKAQKAKADRVVELLKQLSEENVTTILMSTPSSEISFLRNSGPVEFDEFKERIKNDAYSPNQSGIKYDSIGY